MTQGEAERVAEVVSGEREPEEARREGWPYLDPPPAGLVTV